MDNSKLTQIHEEHPKRLSWTPEENERFARNKELFMLFKDDFSVWNTKIAELLESFESKQNTPSLAWSDTDDFLFRQIKSNTQNIRTICEDLIGNYLSEIPFIIMYPEFGWIKEAKHRRNEIQLLYKQLENTKNKEKVLSLFRKIKGKKHWTWGHTLYTLQEWECWISLIRSELEKLS